MVKRSLSPAAQKFAKRMKFSVKKRTTTMEQVKKYIDRRTEKKVVQLRVTPFNIAAGGQQAGMVNIAQGDTVDSREGHEIFLKNITIDMFVHPSTDNVPPDDGDVVKVALVWDHQPNGAQATFSDVFNALAGLGGQAQRNFRDNQQRFKILWEETTVIYNQLHPYYNGSTASEISRPFQVVNGHYKKYVDLEKAMGKDAMIRYGTSTSNPPVSGNLFLCWACNGNSATAAENPIIGYTTSLRYSDK